MSGNSRNFETFSIGEAARRLDVCAATLRIWENQGKLVPASRTPGNRRLYSATQIEEFKANNPDYKYARTSAKVMVEEDNADGEMEEV